MNAVPSVFHLASMKPTSMKGIDPDFIKIEHDSPFFSPRKTVNKFAPLFAKLKINSALVCEPSEAPKLAEKLREWLKDTGKPYKVKQVSNCPDGHGRVWLLAK